MAAVFTALHTMKGGISDRIYVRLSVRLSLKHVNKTKETCAEILIPHKMAIHLVF